MKSDEVADLTNFLRARIEEDEAAAQAVKPGTVEDTAGLKARVLADVAAKRGVLRFLERMQQHAGHDDFMVHGPARFALSATTFPLRHLVAAYATHPDFRPEWGPNEEEIERDPRFSRSGRA
ncbi:MULTISPECIES: DUF6221 family protein [Streptomyces]|uniref:Uncharacterized protein n=1 Tax=Streptomyces rimosus subsp. rimosus TaxID=132474 RepID=A0ABY3YTN1_STRRM|nr:hypothetical protein DF17_00320 [Streptomyces rimosus]KOG70974.1 hypothetical protein ADK78_26885 [Kitasatospora aureofaciens]KOT33187.1 hypothetical protein ADK84_26450 [Streptomyces sp. NRRL WC-3701]KOT40149.1 hypothetical protein ADK42_12650 [Streptomyces rimosus subsp. rimosus]KEF14550.1 hypothetical protein DF18_35070 [Streptomyces rimosus]